MVNQASCLAVVKHLEGYKVNELSFLKARLHYTLEPASNGTKRFPVRLHYTKWSPLHPEPALSRTRKIGSFERVPWGGAYTLPGRGNSCVQSWLLDGAMKRLPLSSRFGGMRMSSGS